MFVIALADFEATEEDQLALKEGDTYIRITYEYGNGWSFGCTVDGSQQGKTLDLLLLENGPGVIKHFSCSLN